MADPYFTHCKTVAPLTIGNVPKQGGLGNVLVVTGGCHREIYFWEHWEH
jgi:hypothetical protein